MHTLLVVPISVRPNTVIVKTKIANKLFSNLHCGKSRHAVPNVKRQHKIVLLPCVTCYTVSFSNEYCLLQTGW